MDLLQMENASCQLVYGPPKAWWKATGQEFLSDPHYAGGPPSSLCKGTLWD